MSARQYATSVLVFGFVCFLAVYSIQRLQSWLPLNVESLPAVSPDSSFNTAISFVTNTNWQGYAGESTMSYATQMCALTVQNFVSAAVGLAVLMALVRGLTRTSAATIGNFWQDLFRGVLYILLPLSLVFALVLVSQGVVQTWSRYAEVKLLEPIVDAEGNTIHVQRVALGPVASQVAIKQLGANGGGYFNANSAHPFENPTPLSNFLEMLAILLIPAAQCFAFGDLVRDRRQGWALLAAMSVLLVPLLFVSIFAEQAGNPTLQQRGGERTAAPERRGGAIDGAPVLCASTATGARTATGGNMEGKETRFGITNSAIWSVATTAASNGSVNAMHDSFTPIGTLVSMWLMQIGEVVFGGVGSGLYGMLAFAVVTVFVSGLMVGRTPEYLGKKIGAFEMKMAVLAIILPCATVLIGTAVSLVAAEGVSSIFNPGARGLSEVLYAWSSASNNNGSAMAGLSANTPFYNGLLGLAMLIGRYWVILPVLALAGGLAAKKSTPIGPGTLPTVIVIVGALTFFPALALGPIVEHLSLMAS
jgi:K+-transporting ATPase ATPase A chain